jgi:hypothetical protein
MTKHWMSTALLCAALATGCGGSSPETTQTPQEPAAQPAAPAPEAAPAPAPEPAPPAEAPAPRREASRPATPARPAARPVSPSASNAAPPAEAPRAPEPPRPTFRDVRAPVGTALALSLITPLSTETAKVETPVTARLRQAVSVDGITVIPAGATLHGDVTEVERAGRVKGRSRLTIRFAEVQVNGQRDPLRTDPITFEGEETKGEDAVKVGGGAGVGALIGGIIGGGSGAAKGAAIGGAAGAGAVLATRGKDVNLAEGAEISATTASSFSIQVQTN